MLAICALAVTLAGCTSLWTNKSEDRMISVSGTNGAYVETQHSGAPWNTSMVSWLFIDNPSIENVTTAVTGLAKQLVDDDSALGDSLTVRVVAGAPEDFEGDEFRTARDFQQMEQVAEELGVGVGRDTRLVLDAEDVTGLGRSA